MRNYGNRIVSGLLIGLLLISGAASSVGAAEGAGGRGRRREGGAGVARLAAGLRAQKSARAVRAPNRLERAGWLDAEWQQTANSRRAKYYRLTRAGRKQLDVETLDWTRRASAVARILKTEA